MTNPILNLLVLRCRDIEAMRQFYEGLGYIYIHLLAARI